MRSESSTSSNSSRRDHLVTTALKLFNRNGYRATGIDTILAQSGVAKMTLYKHFKSKDELIVAAMRKSSEDFVARMNDAISRLAGEQSGDPRLASLFAFFDALDEWFNSEGFYGCNFINASAEFLDGSSPVHKAAADSKYELLRLVASTLKALPLQQPEGVAQQVYLLVEGAIVAAHTLGDKSAARLAKDAVIRLLSSYEI